MGSQTGVSLYAPSTGASLVTMRGTDGIASGAGVMPLTWLQDFAGPMGRTTSDVARILNATTGTDPDDIFTTPQRRRRQAARRLQGRAGPERAPGQEDRLLRELVHRQPELRPGRRDAAGAEGALRRHRGRRRDAGPDHGLDARLGRHRDADGQPHRGGLAALLRAPRRPAVRHRGGDPRLAARAPVQPRRAQPRATAHRRGRRQDPRLARREQAALGGVHGFP